MRLGCPFPGHGLWENTAYEMQEFPNRDGPHPCGCQPDGEELPSPKMRRDLNVCVCTLSGEDEKEASLEVRAQVVCALDYLPSFLIHLPFSTFTPATLHGDQRHFSKWHLSPCLSLKLLFNP